jgi:neural Wiskott-Aldrich syndrome protein
MHQDMSLLGNIVQQDHGTLGLVINNQGEACTDEPQAQPPPAMDDPSDPPPSIDSDFRLPEGPRPHSPNSSPPPHPAYTSPDTPTPSVPPAPPVTADGHAPPPYLGEQHVARPPPYVD